MEEKIYSVIAPKHAMVIISPVFPVRSAMIPITILMMRALAGVLNFLCTCPKAGGIYFTRPNSKVALPEARIMP